MQNTIQQLLHEAQDQLCAVTENPVLDAEILLAYVINKPRSYLRAWPEANVAKEMAQQFTHYLQRRCDREPIAYLVGTKEFWSLELQVSKDTLIPRPESELLVETVLKLFSSQSDVIKIADLGTGSGAIALALAHENAHWQICATDVSENALQIASNNAQRLGLQNVSFYPGSWCTALPNFDFNVIVSNPPYIAETEWQKYEDGLAFEPRSALVSGLDGLKAIREISQSSLPYLKTGGYLIVEHGFLQGQATRDVFAADGFRDIYTVCDLSGKERITVGCK